MLRHALRSKATQHEREFIQQVRPENPLVLSLSMDERIFGPSTEANRVIPAP
jgi:hypothetical protein